MGMMDIVFCWFSFRKRFKEIWWRWTRRFHTIFCELCPVCVYLYVGGREGREREREEGGREGERGRERDRGEITILCVIDACQVSCFSFQL